MALVKKREPRKSVRQAAWITLEGGFAARQCEVLDLSQTGARISVSDPVALTGMVWLSFTRDISGRRACDIVWRKGRTLGLRFR